MRQLKAEKGDKTKDNDIQDEPAVTIDEADEIEALKEQIYKLKEDNTILKADAERLEGFTLDLTLQVAESLETLQKIHLGNLSLRLNEDSEIEIMKHLSTYFNKILDTPELLVKEIQKVVTQMETSAAQISATSAQQASGVSQTASSLSEITTTIEELSITAGQIAETASLVNNLAEGSLTKAVDGTKSVDGSLQGTTEIKKSTEEAAEKILELGEKSHEITEVVEVIYEIARQTNLLALNASIEAARAGEAGRGFAVVAAEVKKLAENVSASTKEIKKSITLIQNLTNASVLAMDNVSNKVTVGENLSIKVKIGLESILEEIQKTFDAAKQISFATSQQKTGSEQIAQTIFGISEVTHQTSNTAKDNADQAKQLYLLSSSLKGLIESYKVR
ncbi:MAG: methyl-accepting chemotaxis protein [Candidatus Xenobiia bacterium LiM19]